jgi:hypothetical protein
MARFRRKARRMFRGFKRGYRRHGSHSGTNMITIGLMAAAYGAFRPKIETIIPAQVSSALGGYGDEVLLGGIGYLAAKGKLGNSPIIKNAGMAIFVTEAVRVGSGVGAGLMGTTSTSSGGNLLG